MSDESNLEKGFNDSELEDIMNEIESLEQEASDDSGVQKQRKEEVVQKSSEKTLEKKNEEIKQVKRNVNIDESSHVNSVNNFSVAELESVNIKGKSEGHKEHDLLNHTNFKSDGTESPTFSRMDFTVSGNMVMHISFSISGKLVQLKLDGSKELVIELGNGARFTLPIDNS